VKSPTRSVVLITSSGDRNFNIVHPTVARAMCNA